MKVVEINIRNVIKERLKLQSTQRALENEFLINNPTFEKVTSRDTIFKVNNWEEKKRKRFVQTVGGKANFKETKELLGII